MLREKKLAYQEICIDKANKPEEFVKISRTVTSDAKHIGTTPLLIGKALTRQVYATQTKQGSWIFKLVDLSRFHTAVIGIAI